MYLKRNKFMFSSASKQVTICTWKTILRVLLGCESIGIIILPRVPLLAARERSRVEILLEASSASAPATSEHLNTTTKFLEFTFVLAVNIQFNKLVGQMFSMGRNYLNIFT